MDYTRQTAYSDPRGFVALVAELPAEVPALGAAVRNLLVHYRASGLTFPPERLAEIDSRWVDRLVGHDQQRFPGSLLTPERPPAERVVGCCRDFTLLTVAALRAHRIPARSRVGFAGYLDNGFHYDHAIAEWWDGSRWRTADIQVDELDVPLAPEQFEPASSVWTRFRRDELDADSYGVARNLPLRGGWFIRNYVLHEVAHRHGDELLLWDVFGVMSDTLDDDLSLIDDVAALVIAADSGDDGAAGRLAHWYAHDNRLHPGPVIRSLSPRGHETSVTLDRG